MRGSPGPAGAAHPDAPATAPRRAGRTPGTHVDAYPAGVPRPTALSVLRLLQLTAAAGAVVFCVAGLIDADVEDLALAFGALAVLLAAPIVLVYARRAWRRRAALARLELAHEALLMMSAAEVPVSAEVHREAVRRTQAALRDCARLGGLGS